MLAADERMDPLVCLERPRSPLEDTHELRSRLVSRLVAHVAIRRSLVVGD